jgi:uncharacterized protein YcbX
MLTISQLFIYPVKSLGGVSVAHAGLTDRGFTYDRRWMLIDENHRFLSQREQPVMALLQTAVTPKGIKVTDKRNISNSCIIPFEGEENKIIKVQVWDDECVAELVCDNLDKWFSAALQLNCKLVFMPDSSMRKVDDNYAANNEITSFSDGYPLLLIGQSSLDDLNSRLKEKLTIDRFRPNIVFTGGVPYEEDTMAEFDINGIDCYGVKQCARCVVTTIEQSNAAKGKEPLKTLAAYRQLNNKIYFGQNVLYKGKGIIKIGDTISIKKIKQGLL